VETHPYQELALPLEHQQVVVAVLALVVHLLVILVVQVAVVATVVLAVLEMKAVIHQ
jgi:hypothetical protein